MRTTLSPRHTLIRCLPVIVAAGLFCLLSPLAAERAAPPSKEVVQKDHDREIARVMGRLNGEDRAADYVLYVVLPLLGLVGSLAFLRRLLLR